jgi:hypothetical protein
VHGKFSTKGLDHIDRNGTNNRLNNLIEASPSIQQFNKGLRKDNTSGHNGGRRHQHG